MLNSYYVSPAISRKVLYAGCEKIYLRFVFIAFFIMALIAMFSGWISDNTVITTIVITVNTGILVLIGQILAKDNPYRFHIAIRHYSYQKVYLAQKSYKKVKINPLAYIPIFSISKISKETCGHRTFEDTDRHV